MGIGPWAILDFPGPDGSPAREVFTDPEQVVIAAAATDVRASLDRVEELARSGLTMVGFVAYDAAPGLEPKFEISPGYDGPLVYFLGFRSSRRTPGSPAESAKPETWSPDFDEPRYRAKVAEIIEGIGRGDYYQVNLTERFSARVDHPLAVYERLRASQAASYCAFIDTAEMAVLSVSPELFVRRSGRTIESRPMKGTSRRGRWADEDRDLAMHLATSEKERAENVMIVDLIRNDMGRIAVPGTVEVPSMFTVEKFPTVLQMTSHVKSQLVESASLGDVFAALFPCGSVTGAPKIAASKAIARLENSPRGVYCGSVGVVRPGGDDFTFNVAIRTATVRQSDSRAIYGAGGGITSDSNPHRELAEIMVKAAVLTSMPQSTDLLETLRLENGQIARLDAHLARLAASADYFGFSDAANGVARIRTEILKAAAQSPSGLHRVRAVLSSAGEVAVTVHPHAPDTRPRRLAIATRRVDSGSPRLYHKTADRTFYAAYLEAVEGADDVILVNERDELTETTIGNLVLEIDGEQLTPALGCGLLPGVLRSELIEAGTIREAILTRDALKRATRVWMINSLRGWVDCVVVGVA